MSDADRKKWDAKYLAAKQPQTTAANAWLGDQALALKPGRALDLACGLGANAILLAERGWQVDAVDVSPVGLGQAAQRAKSIGVTVNWIPADLDDYAPVLGAYDLVIVFRFLERTLLPKIIEAALRPGGVLLYETFREDQAGRAGGHCRNPRFLLKNGELLELFPHFSVLEYAEIEAPDGSYARLAAQKDLSVPESLQ